MRRKERKRVHLEDGSVWTYIIERVPDGHCDQLVVRIYSPERHLHRPTEGQLASVAPPNIRRSTLAPSTIKAFILQRLLKK